MLTALKNYIGFIGEALWFRPALAGLAAVLLAAVVAYLDAWVPRGAFPWLPKIELETVRDLLKLLAGSMLTVITVTQSVLMLALSLVAGQASPRAMPELLSDKVAQNALGVFLATFVFALATLLFFGMGLSSGSGITLSFAIAVVLLIAAIIHLVYLIGHVANALKLNRIIHKIYRQGSAVLENYFAKSERLVQASGPTDEANSRRLHGTQVGYIQFIDIAKLDAITTEKDLRVALASREGRFCHPGQVLMTVFGLGDDAATAEALLSAVALGFERSPVNDPLLGFDLLAEVACRSLSPSVNDPQSALACIEYQGSLLSKAASTPPDGYPPGISPSGRVTVLPTSFKEISGRALNPIIRDGAGNIEVLVVLAALLRDLLAVANPAHLPEIETLCQRLEESGEKGLALERDRRLLEDSTSALKRDLEARQG